MLFYESSACNLGQQYINHVFLITFLVWHLILCRVSNESMLVLLIDKLKQSAPSRIVNVSSVAHKMFGPLDLANLNSEKSVTKHSWYSHSKLAQILFTRELSRRLQGSGLLFIQYVLLILEVHNTDTLLLF